MLMITAAIKSKINLVTIGCIFSTMRDLEAVAEEAGTVVMNEASVDPGVDRLYAIKTIGEVLAKE